MSRRSTKEEIIGTAAAKYFYRPVLVVLVLVQVLVLVLVVVVVVVVVVGSVLL